MNFEWTRFFGPTFNWYTWDRLNYFFLPTQLDHRNMARCSSYYYFLKCSGNMGCQKETEANHTSWFQYQQNLLNLPQQGQTWPRRLAAQYCLGGTSTVTSRCQNLFSSILALVCPAIYGNLGLAICSSNERMCRSQYLDSGVSVAQSNVQYKAFSKPILDAISLAMQSQFGKFMCF